MPVNPFFNQVTFVTEQNLINDLIVEAIQIYGHSAYYLRREDVDVNTLFGEDPLAKYPTATEIELYLKNSTSFSGSSEIFGKFGMVIEDQATFIVAASRFASVEPLLSRPRENDIIYIEFSPTNRYLFEIRFVENKEQLFQLGKLYTFELRCEIMNYGHERVQTGNSNIDGVATREAYSLDLHFTSGTGTYQVSETVYQGPNVIEAVATGTVKSWNANTMVLTVQNVVGEFGNTESVIGSTSHADYLIAETPNTLPSDPLSDNQLLVTEQPLLVKPVTNPRFN